jgi:predicted RNase H-like nuclease (RuvC/YqgF family)
LVVWQPHSQRIKNHAASEEAVDPSLQMLTKRCETLSHAAEVESKKTKREIAVLEKEVAALKADITSKEKEAKVTGRREVTLFRKQWMRLVTCWSATSC